MKHALFTLATLLIVASALPTLIGCGVPTGPLPGGGDNAAGDNGDEGNGDGTDNGANNGDTGGSGDAGGDDVGTTVEPVSAAYDPASALTLEAVGLKLVIPAGATLAPATITLLPASAAASPGAIPGAVDLAGGQFEPGGLQFLLPVEVTAALHSPTVATALPVITFDEATKRWVGTGDVGTVSPTGDEVIFPLDHFSLVGVPDPLPLPVGGDSVPDLVTIPNLGIFSSAEISSDTASLTYSSAVGGSLSIDVRADTVNDAGQPQVLFMRLSAVRVALVNQFVVAEIGGAGSVFDVGDFRSIDEPLVGTAVLSISGSTVNVTVFVASSNRVIFGIMSGEAG